MAGSNNRVVIEEVTGKLKPEGLERTSSQTEDNNSLLKPAVYLPKGGEQHFGDDSSLSHYCQLGGDEVTHLSAFSPTHTHILNDA